jgi:hypothetical protein
VCAAPSQIVQLELESTADGTVDLALAGNYADAALAAGTVAVVGGHAQVTLQTSSTPTTFAVVARPGGDVTTTGATVEVAVGASGFARVLATPTYTGNRAAPAFLATTVVLSTCAELGGTASADGGAPAAQPWLSEPAGTPIALSVPAEERFAVEVRVGHYVTGCADVAPLAATTTTTVSVTAYDVPMALGQTDLNATFTFAPTSQESSAWTSALAAAVGVAGDQDAGAPPDTVAGAFFDSATDGTPDGTALLAAMDALVPSADQAAFEQSETTGGWAAATQTWLGAHAPSMNARAVAWLQMAATDAIGPLVVHLGPGTVLDTDPVTATTFGPSALTATLAGITVPQSFSWSANADDTVHLAGSISLAARTYAVNEANADAASAVAGATDVPSAIASEIDCAGLAASLVGTSDAYVGCGAACVATLCAQAIGATWSTAVLATTSPTAPGNGTLQISLTLGAPAQVGDTAEPVYFEGSWLGQVTETPSGVPAPFSIGGTVTGLAPQSP